MELAKAYKECEKVIKIHSKTFYRAFSMLPSKERNAVWAIYSFCRTVDDIVDESDNPEEELAQFEEEFDRFLSGAELNEANWIALSDVFKRYDMNVQAFKDMVKGQKMDLAHKTYETTDDVLEYSYHVASTVGLMLLPVLAPENEKALRDSAVKLGYAMQITNILRDVGEDLDRQRVYLPAEVMSRHGYDESLLLEKQGGQAFIDTWEEMASMAEGYYDEAMKSLYLYPPSSRIPVKGAAILYRAILDQVRKNNYNVFSEKNYVPVNEKNKLLSSYQ
ncbi:phytoene/squalene synthase family protein [Jeotgalibacillus salarius]|uniref:Squalene/phytoene synthase family protein n=1 Tax=Jeotgalibacillus salarius TaxID=546023 RepID=A0A4Y8LAS9_9BACL|nr:phytoene/squalene synthase family protein [Jeotgalibacillus salarius]TFD99264.1 squalene/phytoene synthase family protein [Jeotgalibacillus salarius]